jgi:predicted transcriptional regulator
LCQELGVKEAEFDFFFSGRKDTFNNSDKNPMKGTVALRRETKKYIDNADVKTVKMIHALLEAEQESDWWDDLAPAEKASIERGLKDVEEGRVVSHEAVMRKYK